MTSKIIGEQEKDLVMPSEGTLIRGKTTNNLYITTRHRDQDLAICVALSVKNSGMVLGGCYVLTFPFELFYGTIEVSQK